MTAAFVSLVGGGLGDVGLLTLRGREALERADVVLYDALAHPELLQFCPGAQKIYVGKQGFGPQTPQEDIHRLLLEHALANGGQRVARLKGGDAFVFGRGGEEALACAEAGIPFEVIPGVSSAIAAAAYAGIPVTHRGVARHFSVVTGHDLGGTHLPAHLAHADTLVVLMGLRSVAEIGASLLAAGRVPETPVAAVERASLPGQRVLRTTLGQMAAAVTEAGIQPPAVLIVGEVAALHERLNWFRPVPQPLAGRQIVVTRTRLGESPLAQRLREHGAAVTEVPLLHFSPTHHPRELIAGVRGHRGWVVFSSEYAVTAFFGELRRAGLDGRALAALKFAAIGTGTQAALAAHQVRADYVPPRSGAGFLGQGLPAGAGELVVHFGSQHPDAALQAALNARQLDYLLLETYRSAPAVLRPVQREALAAAEVVTLSSSIAARALAEVAGTDYPVLSIGPQTTAAARAAGFTRLTETRRADLEGMVAAVLEERGKGAVEAVPQDWGG